MSPEEKFYLGVAIVLGVILGCAVIAKFSPGDEEGEIHEGGARPQARAQLKPARLRKAERFVTKPSGTRNRSHR